MKYSGASIVTTHQVGSTVFVVRNNEPRTATVKETISTKTGSGSVVTTYKTEEYPGVVFPSNLVFADKTAIETYLDNLVDAL